MRTIIIFPFPEFGHINPTLKLAKRLIQAGNRILYLGIADFAEYIRGQGLEFIPVLESRYPTGVSGERSAKMKVGRVELIMREDQEVSTSTGSDLLKEVRQEIADIIQHQRPDLFIADVLIGGLAHTVKEQLGVATAVLSVTLLDDLAPDASCADLPMLVLCPRVFDFRAAVRNSRRYHIEASVDLERHELHPFPWDALDNKKPLIYCSFGSESHLYDKTLELMRMIAEAMREKPDWQLVLSIGPYVRHCDLHPVAENVIVVNWAPQLQILAKAALMITHGGLGTIKECILLGVPMIVFPFRWDQPFNAARVVAHGLGVRGEVRNIAPGRIVDLVNRVANDLSFKRRIHAMSLTFNQIENSGIGVKVIEGLITGSPRIESDTSDSLVATPASHTEVLN